MSEFEALKCIHPICCELLPFPYWWDPSENFKEDTRKPKKCPCGQLCNLWEVTVSVSRTVLKWSPPVSHSHWHLGSDSSWQTMLAWQNQRWTSSVGRKMSCWLRGWEAERSSGGPCEQGLLTLTNRQVESSEVCGPPSLALRICTQEVLYCQQ